LKVHTESKATHRNYISNIMYQNNKFRKKEKESETENVELEKEWNL